MEIPETKWGQIEQTRAKAPDSHITEIPNELNIIRDKAHLTKICNTAPTVLAWLTKDYTDKEVKRAITNLKNNKANGSDGIPGEVYKALRKHITQPIRLLMNKIQHGQPIPQCWKEGTLVHI